MCCEGHGCVARATGATKGGGRGGHAWGGRGPRSGEVGVVARHTRRGVEHIRDCVQICAALAKQTYRTTFHTHTHVNTLCSSVGKHMLCDFRFPRARKGSSATQKTWETKHNKPRTAQAPPPNLISGHPPTDSWPSCTYLYLYKTCIHLLVLPPMVIDLFIHQPAHVRACLPVNKVGGTRGLCWV